MSKRVEEARVSTRAHTGRPKPKGELMGAWAQEPMVEIEVWEGGAVRFLGGKTPISTGEREVVMAALRFLSCRPGSRPGVRRVGFLPA